MHAYFAYGANLDRSGMAARCPDATLLAGPARLVDHRFVIMEQGYATVVPSPGSVVHGLLWQVSADDLAALDRFEEVAAALYTRRTIVIEHRAVQREALIYESVNMRGRVAPCRATWKPC